MPVGSLSGAYSRQTLPRSEILLVRWSTQEEEQERLRIARLGDGPDRAVEGEGGFELGGEGLEVEAVGTPLSPSIPHDPPPLSLPRHTKSVRSAGGSTSGRSSVTARGTILISLRTELFRD